MSSEERRKLRELRRKTASWRSPTPITRDPSYGGPQLTTCTMTTEDVPSSVELRRRPGEHQAAFTSSLCTTDPTDLAVSRSSAARSVGRCR
ncbi:MAG: hypothetical protein QOE41_1368 [Mycobacterium sp.]|nr:hypothetical protein [Mycobacterium sp.]